MKLNKEQLALLYMCVSNELDTYTMEMINKDGIKYAQLNILLNEIKKELK